MRVDTRLNPSASNVNVRLSLSTVTDDLQVDFVPAGNELTSTILDRSRTECSATPVTVSIGDAEVVENVSGGTVTFTVTLSEAVSSAVALDLAYAPLSPNPVTLADDLGSDRPTTVTIPTNRTSFDFKVPITDDPIVEGTETFTVTISENPDLSDVVIDNATATGTITDDDTGVVTLDPPTAMAAENGTFNYTVKLSAAADEAVNITWTATAEDDDTATVADDLDEHTGTVTFDPGTHTDETFSIVVTDDFDDEPNETFTVTLSATSALPDGVDIDDDNASSVATITDNDGPPTVFVSINNAPSTSEGTDARFTVTLSDQLLEARTLNLTYAARTAELDELGSDRPTTLTLPTGTTSVDFDVPTVEDDFAESNETFTVTLSLPTPAPSDPRNRLVITEAEGQGTIGNDELANISIEDQTRDEGGAFRFRITTTDARNSSDVRLTWTVTDDTATVNDDLDLSSSTGSLTLPASEGATRSEVFLDIPIADDDTTEASETFTVTLTADGTPPGGVRFPPETASATGTITDNDTGEVTLSTTTPTVAENGTFTYTVSLSNPADEAVDITWTASDGTATVDDDLQATTNTVTFDANDNTDQTFTIAVTDDEIVEGDETFTVTLTATNTLPTGVSIPTATNTHVATATITDTDTATVSLDSTAPPSAPEGTTITFTVNLDNPVAETFSLGWAATDGTATVNDDLDDQSGTVEIPADAQTATFDIAVASDDAGRGQRDVHGGVDRCADGPGEHHTEPDNGRPLCRHRYHHGRGRGGAVDRVGGNGGGRLAGGVRGEPERGLGGSGDGALDGDDGGRCRCGDAGGGELRPGDRPGADRHRGVRGERHRGEDGQHRDGGRCSGGGL